jgi:purine-binding chemotaxis protein CheW
VTDDRNQAATALREAFDRGFAEPPRAAGDDRVALLALLAGQEQVAVRVLEAAGLLPARPIVAVPSRRPELLGVAGVRGAVVPIWSAARLLGRADAGPPAWIVLAGAVERVGLAFEAFEGHLLVAPSALAAAPGAGHVAGALRTGDAVRPVLSIPSLLAAITRTRDSEPSR